MPLIGELERFARFERLLPFEPALATRIAARVLRLMGGARGRISRLPLGSGWTLGRDMPAPEGRTFRELYASRRKT